MKSFEIILSFLKNERSFYSFYQQQTPTQKIFKETLVRFSSKHEKFIKRI